MKKPFRLSFFNFFRNFFRIFHLEPFLAALTQGKGYDDLPVKFLPQNYQYPKRSFRQAKRNGIHYTLDLSEYMEWVIYFGLNVEERQGLYPLVKPGMVVFDIGSNIGETLLNFASLAGPSGKVYGFEPVKENFEKCMKNISLNRFSNISLQNIALSDKNETLYFGTADNFNSGGIFMNREKSVGSMEAKAVTLDDFVKETNISRIDLIKLDVEGFEHHVLRGGRETLERYRPVLFVEVDDENLKRQGSGAAELTSFLLASGYQVENSGGGSGKHYDIICTPVKKK